jgi:hypothetical protein
MYCLIYIMGELAQPFDTRRRAFERFFKNGEILEGAGVFELQQREASEYQPHKSFTRAAMAVASYFLARINDGGAGANMAEGGTETETPTQIFSFVHLHFTSSMRI